MAIDPGRNGPLEVELEKMKPAAGLHHHASSHHASHESAPAAKPMTTPKVPTPKKPTEGFFGVGDWSDGRAGASAADRISCPCS